MKIAVLGAGKVGSPLTRAFAAAGHIVTLANSRGPETIRDLASSLGADAAYAADAVRDADAIVIAVKPHSYASVRVVLGDAPSGTPVIDTGNYHPLRDGAIEAIEEGQSETDWICEQLERRVTKAWNAVLAGTLADKGVPSGTSGRIALPVAGDDPDGKRIASTLVDASGFDPVDIGGLADSWRVQPGTPAYCTELPRRELIAAVERADVHHAPILRDVSWKVFETFGNEFTSTMSPNIVRVYRAITRTPDPLN